MVFRSVTKLSAVEDVDVPNAFSNDKSFVIILISIFLNALGRMSKKTPLGVLLLQFFGRETSAAILCHEYFTDNILSSEASLWQQCNHHPSP